jgi:hypothetical protein
MCVKGGHGRRRMALNKVGACPGSRPARRLRCRVPPPLLRCRARPSTLTAAARLQRQRLYALDELEQCTMRMRLLSDDELRLREGEEIYRVYAHEVPVRSTVSRCRAACFLAACFLAACGCRRSWPLGTVAEKRCSGRQAAKGRCLAAHCCGHAPTAVRGGAAVYRNTKYESSYSPVCSCVVAFKCVIISCKRSCPFAGAVQ